MHKKTAEFVYTLKNWAIIQYDNVPGAEQFLSGNVYGHPDIKNGEKITTSRIVCRDAAGIITTASGSRYLLLPQDVDPDYEKTFPNAFVRLFRKVNQ